MVKHKTSNTETNTDTKTNTSLDQTSNDSEMKFPLILSFDVGVIHLSYCLLTKKEFIKPDGTKYLDWHIVDWNNIDLTNRDEQKCHCGAKANLSNVTNGETKYYCKTHGKKVDTTIKQFEECFKDCPSKEKKNFCGYSTTSKSETKNCGKSASFYRMINTEKGDNPCYYCTTHAKQLYKTESNSLQLKSFKLKSSTSLNFDDVKYGLLMELEKRSNLLSADYVVIENQPSFKNPRMKSIATTLYDYYLIRGVLDKAITKSNISQVKFMSPSNKLKLADDGDTKQLIKAKSTDDTKAYKLTKSLGIKYCLDLTSHLTEWQKHFNSHKKKDDLADSFLQGAYFYTNNVKDSTNSSQIKKRKKVKDCHNTGTEEKQSVTIENPIDLIEETKSTKPKQQKQPRKKNTNNLDIEI